MLALWIIFGLIALFILLSLLPISLYVKVKRDRLIEIEPENRHFSYEFSIHLPLKCLGFRVRGDSKGTNAGFLFGSRQIFKPKKLGREKKGRKSKTKEDKDGKRKKGEIREKKNKKRGKFIDFFRERELLSLIVSAGLKFFGDIFSCFRNPKLRGNIELGFGDPALMGIFTGFIYSISSRGMVLDRLLISPNYLDATFAGEVTFNVSIKLFFLILAFIKLLFRLPIIRLIKLIRRMKRSTKKMEVIQNAI